LVDGRVAEGMGVYFLKDELKRGHLNHVWLGIKNYGNVKKAARASEVEGLKYFFHIIGETGDANLRDFYCYARKYIEKHSLPGAKEFILYFAEKIPVFISTIGSKPAAWSANKLYQCYSLECVANPVKISNDSVITGVEIKIRDGKDKLEATKEMLARKGYDIKNGIALGDSLNDHEIFKASKLAIASPLADDDTKRLVRELKGIVAEDYFSALEEFKR
jgi:phosphoserine phosphatase